MSEWRKWMKFTEEHRKNISLSRKWKPNGRLWIKTWIPAWNKWKHYETITWEKNHNWKWWITDKNHKIRESIEMKLWRDVVFARDGYTCQKYWIRWWILHPHHILNFLTHPELRFAIDNWITLSAKEHRMFHKIYWNRNNTR